MIGDGDLVVAGQVGQIDIDILFLGDGVRPRGRGEFDIDHDAAVVDPLAGVELGPLVKR